MLDDKYTMREWFTLLEPDVRRKLIENMRRQGKLHRLNTINSSFGDALSCSMSWNSSPEGADYWYRQRCAADENTKKPRQDIDCTIPEQ
jgi:hypothetical protein